MRRIAILPVLLAALALAACVTPAAPPPSPLPAPPTPGPNSGALWHIAHDLCVPNQRDHAQPAPCALVAIQGGEARGYVVLKDRAGIAQHLVMPTVLMPGVEDPRLLAPDAPNIFAEAWDARRFVEQRLGHSLARDLTAVAVNSHWSRSQELLHLHVDCLSAASRDAIAAAHAGHAWSAQPVTIGGHPYRIMRLDGANLGRRDPFHLLADGLPGARSQMAAWTLVLTGATFADGRQGFWLLAGRADPAHGEFAGGELLQDHDCKDAK